MLVEIVQEVQIKLSLTAKEADWLKTIMQNPINIKFPQDEDEKDKTMRELFFNSLPDKKDI